MKTNLTYPVYMYLGELAVLDYHPVKFTLMDEEDNTLKVKIDVPAKYIANAEQIIQEQISANEVSNIILSLEGLKWVYNQVVEVMRPTKPTNDEFDEDF